MSGYPLFPSTDKFSALGGKVVVVTGGASGIGADLVRLLYLHGANVTFGDINQQLGEALITTLLSENQSSSPKGQLTFSPCDVRSYNQMYNLFRTARDKYGHVDHAVFCAGVVESTTSPYFDANLTPETVGQDPGDTRALDVNFTATCAFARISLPFLRSRSQSSGSSLTFLSSVTGFRDAPGMFLYQTSKQAILGLMRAMRAAIYARDGIRINAVCPGMTETPMTSDGGLIDLFKNRSQESQAELPSHYQSSAVVAEHVVSVMVSEGLNGKSIYIEEGKGWDFEDGLIREMPRWLGEEPTRLSNDNLAFLASKFG
ncbi:hypothetical protein B0A52_03835 [Exophiala mesophila]|uniref:3-hydroxyacyl-CoA dehydrogenase type-2 n=1 Tax=Exophiala mesophila TaxID=212818 RepID=A0A438N7A7_EXOME|nr:hypothetical protein B0A52_03835 [Exophiala mesophila]